MIEGEGHWAVERAGLVWAPGEFQPRRTNWKHMCLERQEIHFSIL